MTGRVEHIGDCTLYLGDCLEILPALIGYDALVSDPPYGVNGGSGTIGAASAKTKYNGAFDDTPGYIRDVCAPAIEAALAVAVRGAITPGGTKNCFSYPAPDDIGFLYQPAAVGLGKWGRRTGQPVLFYGTDPRAGKTIQPIHFLQTVRAEECGHPCPKPLAVMEWLVERASLGGETVLDPFMGSGTTGVACVKLGRKFIGIEIDEGYFDIACKRIKDAYAQPDIFIEAEKKAEQFGMDLG